MMDFAIAPRVSDFLGSYWLDEFKCGSLILDEPRNPKLGIEVVGKGAREREFNPMDVDIDFVAVQWRIDQGSVGRESMIFEVSPGEAEGSTVVEGDSPRIRILAENTGLCISRPGDSGVGSGGSGVGGVLGEKQQCEKSGKKTSYSRRVEKDRGGCESWQFLLYLVLFATGTSSMSSNQAVPGEERRQKSLKLLLSPD